MTFSNKTVSSWVRQTRYRAKNNNIYSDLTVADVNMIINASNGRCSYCDKSAAVLDCPFPLRDGVPHTPANVVVCCTNCKVLKSNNDVTWLFANGHLNQERYFALLQELVNRRGGDLIKTHIKRITGLST